MKNKLFLAWMVLALAATACLCSGGGNSPGVSSGPASIGQIDLVTADVEHNK